MADWTAPLPAEAVEGAETHVADHNKIRAALIEARTNVDGIELTPGPEGPRGPAGKDGADSTVAGPKGATGPAGKDGAPSQEDWDALVARVTALEA